MRLLRDSRGATGTVAIDNQHVRGMLAMFFAKTRMGWKETVVNRVNDHPQEQGWAARS